MSESNSSLVKEALEKMAPSADVELDPLDVAADELFQAFGSDDRKAFRKSVKNLLDIAKSRGG